MAQCAIVINGPKAGLNVLKDSGGATVDYVIGGTLATQSLTPADCPGMVVITPAEYESLQVMYGFPTVSDFSTAFQWGFCLVVGSYMFAWGAGAVLNMFRGKS